MSEPKDTAEPSGASGGSLACCRRQNTYKTAKSLVMEAQDMDTVTALRTLNYSAEKLADLISGGLDDPQVRMAVRAACLRELAWVDKLLEERWIPVCDRLPDEGRLVLVFPGRLPFAIRERVRWVDPLYGWTCAEEPTHWMALPSPPTSDK